MTASRNERRRTFGMIDMLEARQLLSATAMGQIPAQSLLNNQGTQSISLAPFFADSQVPTGDTVVNIQTNLPAPNNNIPIYLTNAATPQTVANFLQYISSGEYADTIIHRSVPGFVIQGGGYTTAGTMINSFGTIPGEYMTATLQNATPGTIAMALSTGPDSATSEWFINLADNSELDTGDGGPFTAFGQTLYNGLSAANAIASLPIVNDTNPLAGGALNTLPVQNLPNDNGKTLTSVPAADQVVLNPVVVPDGVNFTVTSSNSAVVSASVSNGSLLLSPVAASGTATIVVTATDFGGGTATESFSVSVAQPDTSHLAFVPQPSNTVASATFAPVSVAVEDANGNVITTDNSDVTLALTGGTSGSTLAGTTTIAAVNGVATFSDLSIATAGDNYALTASDGAFQSAISNDFDVATPAPPSPLVPTLGHVVLPSAVVLGAKIKASVPVVVTNTGSAFKGSVTVNLYADTDTTLSGSPVLVGSTVKTLNLKAGRKGPVNFNLKSLPSTLGVGTYHLVAQVVDPSAQTNVTATTQTLTVAAPFVSPEATVAAVKPSTIATGKRGSVVVTITNAGNETASGIDISLSPSIDGVSPVSGEILDSVQSGGKIAPGKKRNFRLSFQATSALAAGTYTPFVSVTLGGVSTTAVGAASFTVG